MSHRIRRINQLIREELSQLLQRQVKDPRLSGFIAVNEVITSPDLKRARVYISKVADEQEKEKILSALASASGYLHSELFKRLQMRHVPELSFHWDDSIERGTHLLELIEQVAEKEKETD
jgi:ribosome-binding factor A